MSQIADENLRTIESASDDTLPAMTDSGDEFKDLPSLDDESSPNESPSKEEDFLARGGQKVELDLEDAPFLKNDPEEPEQKNNVSESNTDADADENADDAKKRKKKLIIISICVTLFLLLAGIVSYFLFFTEEEPILENIIVVPGNDVKSQVVAKQVQLAPFFIECTDINGKKHFIEATFALTTKDNYIFNEINNNQRVLRDAIYYYLQIQPAEKLLDTRNQKELKTGLLEAINEYVVNGSVEELLVESYLIK